jgi:hypothetical protein
MGWIASDGNTLIERSTNRPEIKGSNPASLIRHPCIKRGLLEVSKIPTPLVK